MRMVVTYICRLDISVSDVLTVQILDAAQCVGQELSMETTGIVVFRARVLHNRYQAGDTVYRPCKNVYK